MDMLVFAMALEDIVQISEVQYQHVDRWSISQRLDIVRTHQV